MPKDPKKNVDRFKVRGGDLNEYDYAKNQEELSETGKRGQKMKNKAGTESEPVRDADKGRKKAG
jgi:hypothetical protein